LIAWLAAPKLAGISPELKATIDGNYQKAIDFLNGKKTRGATTDIEYSGVASMTGMNTW
jgi:hypothetical protein